MKVVLFCGGYGMRMRDGVSDVPKPMAMVGNRPLIWHVMRFYAHHGHKDFVLCLGYGAHHIKRYFLDYDETYSNDFVLRDGGRSVEMLTSDISDWTISFVDTGLNSAIGERLRRVRHLVADDEMFLANYADVLTDVPLPDMIERMQDDDDMVASLMAVPPQSAFHCLELDADSRVSEIRAVNTMPLWENGGYFVLRQGIFDVLPEGGDLVADACVELSRRGQLSAYQYRGFWQPADTVKERVALEHAYDTGTAAWMVWADDQRGGTALEETPPVVSVLGAHCDDIEIGAGATLLQLVEVHPGLVVDATVVTSTPERAAETRAALAAFLPGADLRLTVHELADGRLPRVWDEVKEVVEAARARAVEAGDSDLVIGPSLADAHQDHRLLAELLPTAFRHHTVWQYEILKWDGDLGPRNVYVPVPEAVAERTWELLHEHFVSQRHRDWFDREAVLGLLRVRGVECHQRYAQAFRADKTVLDLTCST